MILQFTDNLLILITLGDPFGHPRAYNFIGGYTSTEN